MNPYGKRLNFRGACLYLDLSEMQLRHLVETNAITFNRSDGRVLTRRRLGKVERYIKGGRLSFWSRDCDAYIESKRVPAKTAPVMRAPRVHTSAVVDREMAALLKDTERHFS